MDTTEQLTQTLLKLVNAGLSRTEFTTTEVVQCLTTLHPERPADAWYALVYRALAGGGPDAEPSALPSDPRFIAARTLFGIEPGFAGASAASRRDAASAHLRARRPKDPYLDADAPLSGRQQRLKLQMLLRDVASDLLDLANQPMQPSARSSAIYDVTSVDYTVRCSPDGDPVEKIEDWGIVARRPLTHFPKTWALGTHDPKHLEMYCIGGQLAKTYDREAGVLVTEVLFGQPLAVGDERTVRFVTRFNGPPPDQHITARSTRPAQLLRVRMQLPGSTPALAAHVAQRDDYEDDQFAKLPHPVEIDHSGYVEVVFRDMLPEWNYGLAWQIDRP